MYINRIVEKTLINNIKTNKVLIILGARQVGKTTLIKHFLGDKKLIFLNLDIEVDKARLIAVAKMSPQESVKALGNPDYIIIDEAQRHLDTGQIVKGWFDAGIKTKIVLLGSSSLNLLNQTAESLTGRNEKIFLCPLLFREVVITQSWYSEAFDEKQLHDNFSGQLNSLLIQSMIFGGYPEAVLTSDKESFLLNLSSDYLLKDVLQIGLVKTPESVKRLLMLLAHQVGSEVSINELAMNLGIGRQTVERYLELLEQTFVIFRLPAFSTNQRKEISKSQKIYFWDTGIRNAILKEFSTSAMRPDI
ncbi:MAG: ATP-binding protein, partial [bacterium]|nr:ATP-binding protein [bacterium]